MSTDLTTEPYLDIAVCDGKYRFTQDNDTLLGSAASISAFRNGEKWEVTNRTLDEMRYTNWLWFLMHDTQETARALRRANAKLEALGQPVEQSPVRLPPLAGPQPAPGKAPPHGGSSGILGVEC